MHIEYHIFFDPTAKHEPVKTTLARARASLLAFEGRLTPRLQHTSWTREPFALWLWDPATPETQLGTAWEAGSACKVDAEVHLWGRVCVGESVDDEWFIIGLLQQLSFEHPDTSVSVADDDGELLLIEAAYALPRWLTPERAANRIFLRSGALHIVPRVKGRKTASTTGDVPDTELPLSVALRALRTGELGATCHKRASHAVSARVRSLMTEESILPAIPSHGARCLLPLPVAKLFIAEPRLVTAAAVAFAERDGATMRLAARMEHCAPRLHGGTVESHVRTGRLTYAQLVSARFAAPTAAGFEEPHESHPSYRSVALGTRLAVGVELLLLHKAEGAKAEGACMAGWTGGASRASGGGGSALHGFEPPALDDELTARGYYRGEMLGSSLHRRLQADAIAALAQAPPAPPRCTWLHAHADRARRLLVGEGRRALDEIQPPEAARLGAAESDAWLGIAEGELEQTLRRRAPPESKGRTKGAAAAGEGLTDWNSVAAARAQEAAQAYAQQLAEIGDSVGAFIGGAGSVEGAELPASHEEPAELNAGKFMDALEGALGGTTAGRRRRGGGGASNGDASGADVGDGDGMNDGDEAEELAAIVAAMDSELASLPASTPEGARASAGTDAVDLNLNLVKNLLASYEAQHGLAGPTSNLLGSIGSTIGWE